jgi:hypothetical protein
MFLAGPQMSLCPMFSTENLRLRSASNGGGLEAPSSAAGAWKLKPLPAASRQSRIAVAGCWPGHLVVGCCQGDGARREWCRPGSPCAGGGSPCCAPVKLWRAIVRWCEPVCERCCRGCASHEGRVTGGAYGWEILGGCCLGREQAE